MIEEPAITTQPRTDLEPRRAGALAYPAARPAGPIAVYDTVTEGMTGWQFLRTWRWFGFIAAAVLFAITCGFLANWQLDRGQQASIDNAIVETNFAAAPVAIEKALPTLDSYDASQNWQRVELRGIYLGSDEFFVRNRPNGSDNGFEVVTPVQLSDGSIFIVDRGWVGPSATDPLSPASVPQPTAGTVDLVVQLRPSETASGAGAQTGNQIQSITPSRIQQTIGGDLYTGAYGVLVSQSPAATPGLVATQTAMPTEDVGTHYSYMIQWLFFAVIGFLALGLAMRKVHRELNSDDPEERKRASERLRKRARKPFTDEELEDEEIDGFIPLTRWGISGGASPAAARVILPPSVGRSSAEVDRLPPNGSES